MLKIVKDLVFLLTFKILSDRILYVSIFNNFQHIPESVSTAMVQGIYWRQRAVVKASSTSLKSLVDGESLRPKFFPSSGQCLFFQCFDTTLL